MGAVRARLQSKLWRHATEQIEQLIALAPSQVCAKLVLQSYRHAHPPREKLTASVCQVQGVRAAIAGVGPALEQPTFLKCVHERNHPARGNLQALAQRLLRLALSRSYSAQQRELPRLQPEWHKAFSKAARHRVAEARKVEPDRAEGLVCGCAHR